MKNLDKKPWERMISGSDGEEKFITDLIRERKMKNDDVTYAVITSGR